MKEYIDRNALLKDICGNDPSRMEDYYYNAIANAPAADVVEVVRCKDCQWWEARSCNSFIGRCENPLNGLFNEYTDDEDFCSYGERKEQE